MFEVSLAIAQRLKDLHFDFITRAYYYQGELLPVAQIPSRLVFEQNQPLENYKHLAYDTPLFISFCANQNIGSDFCSAPTFEEVEYWFLTVHNISLSFRRNDEGFSCRLSVDPLFEYNMYRDFLVCKESAILRCMKYLEEKQSIFLMFWGENCGPCDHMKPIVEVLESRWKDVVTFTYLNYSQNREKAEDYKVSLVPTFILKTPGMKSFRKLVGTHTEEDLNMWIKNCIELV